MKFLGISKVAISSLLGSLNNWLLNFKDKINKRLLKFYLKNFFIFENLWLEFYLHDLIKSKALKNKILNKRCCVRYYSSKNFSELIKSYVAT